MELRDVLELIKHELEPLRVITVLRDRLLDFRFVLDGVTHGFQISQMDCQSFLLYRARARNEYDVYPMIEVTREIDEVLAFEYPGIGRQIKFKKKGESELCLLIKLEVNDVSIQIA